MRLWHQDLIAYLPYQQLLGQHREIFISVSFVGYSRNGKKRLSG